MIQETLSKIYQYRRIIGLVFLLGIIALGMLFFLQPKGAALENIPVQENTAFSDAAENTSHGAGAITDGGAADEIAFENSSFEEQIDAWEKEMAFLNSSF